MLGELAVAVGQTLRQGCYSVTVNVPALVAVPPGVVTAIGPVFAPVGASAVTSVADFTLNVVAFTPPNVTAVAPVRPVPVIVTSVPTGPLSGEKAVTTGVTLKVWTVVRVPLGVLTVILPVFAAEGMTAVISELETTLKVDATPSNFTEVVPVRFVPKMVIVDPTTPEEGSAFAKGPSPKDKL